MLLREFGDIPSVQIWPIFLLRMYLSLEWLSVNLMVACAIGQIFFALSSNVLVWRYDCSFNYAKLYKTVRFPSGYL